MVKPAKLWELDVCLERLRNHKMTDLEHVTRVRTEFHISNKNSFSFDFKTSRNWTSFPFKSKVNIASEAILIGNVKLNSSRRNYVHFPFLPKCQWTAQKSSAQGSHGRVVAHSPLKPDKQTCTP